MTFALEDNKKVEIGAVLAPIFAFYHHSLGRFSVVHHPTLPSNSVWGHFDEPLLLSRRSLCTISFDGYDYQSNIWIAKE